MFGRSSGRWRVPLALALAALLAVGFGTGAAPAAAAHVSARGSTQGTARGSAPSRRPPSPPRRAKGLTGRLQRIAVDDLKSPHPSASEDVTITQTNGHRFHVPARLVGSIPSGSTVTVQLSSDSSLPPGTAADNGSNVTSVQATQASSVSVTGTHHLIVVPVYWGASVPVNEPSPITLQTAVTNVDSYYNTVTNGAIRVTADQILGWQSINPPTAGQCPSDAVQTKALQAAGVVPNTEAYTVVAYFPADSDCNWTGLGSVGGNNASQFIWLNGYDDTDVFAHEFGHNLGWEHSGSLACWTDANKTTLTPLSSTCTQTTYADPWDIMGNSPSGHLGFPSASHLHQIGVITSQYEKVLGNEQVQLIPLESTGTSGLRGFQFAVGERIFYGEYRTPTGMDSWINSYPASSSGVAIRMEDATAADGEQNTLDFHPTSGYPNDVMTLQSGQTWTSGDGLTSIAVTSANASGATVSITRPLDTTPPEPFDIYYPANGDVVPASTDVAWGPITDLDSGVTEVDIDVDGQKLYTLQSSEFNGGSTTVSLANLADGGHSVSMVAFDLFNNHRTVGPVPVTLDNTPPTLQVDSPLLLWSPVTTGDIYFTGSDGANPAPTFVCSQDNGPYAPCTSPVHLSGLADGSHIFDVFALDQVNNSTGQELSWHVDTRAPTATLKSPTAVGTTSTSVVVTWSGADVGSAVAGYQLRYRRAAYSGGFGAYAYPSSWQNLGGSSLTHNSLALGYDYCYSVRSVDYAGNASAWTPDRCTAIALDDRSLTAATTGWTRTTSRVYWRGTATVTKSYHAALTRTYARLDRVGIVATRCSSCGVVAVYVGTSLVGKINLYSATTGYRRLIMLPRFTYRTGTVKIVVLTSGKTVQIDGLVISRT